MKTIFFDLDGTLYSRTVPFTNACKTFFNLSDEEALLADRYVAIRGDEVFLAHQQGKITSEEMYIYRYRKGFGDAGITITDRQALDFYQQYQYELDHLVLPEETAVMLQECTKHFPKIGIITNGPSQHQRGKIKAMGLDKWIDEELIFISGELNCAKPDEKIFITAAEKSGNKANELIMVGDSYINDIITPHDLNWLTVHISNNTPADSVADHTVSSIKELTAILNEIS